MIALKDSIGSDLVERIHAIFSESGLLAKAKNFEYRPEQQQMAVAVARALEEERHFVVEAGTGKRVEHERVGRSTTTEQGAA